MTFGDDVYVSFPRMPCRSRPNGGPCWRTSWCTWLSTKPSVTARTRSCMPPRWPRVFLTRTTCSSAKRGCLRGTSRPRGPRVLRVPRIRYAGQRSPERRVRPQAVALRRDPRNPSPKPWMWRRIARCCRESSRSSLGVLRPHGLWRRRFSTRTAGRLYTSSRSRDLRVCWSNAVVAPNGPRVVVLASESASEVAWRTIDGFHSQRFRRERRSRQAKRAAC